MVGRFQVMAILQAARAKVLGFSDEEAQSFGLNRAIFYAAAKRGFKGGSTKRQGGTMSVKESPYKKSEKKLHTEAVGDEQAFYVTKNGRKYFVMGDEMLEAEDFHRQIITKFPLDFIKVWHEAVTMMEHTDREVLESQRKFYEKVYKPHRDELAAKWSEPS
jgi:hypothetical protein